MKTFRFIGMAIVAIIMSVNFAACSDDDDDNSSNNPLIGTWQEADGGDDYLIWTFKADGKAVEQNYYHGEIEGPYPFTYTYDSKTSILVVDYGEGDIDNYDVTIKGNTMITKDRDYGYETTWNKK